MTLAPLQFPVDYGPDHIKPVLVLIPHCIKPLDRFLGQRHQKALIPEFLASHKSEYKSYIRY